MKKQIFHLFLGLLPAFAILTGCSEDKTKGSSIGPTNMESVSILPNMAEVSKATTSNAVNADDPTMSSAETRSTHVMTVALGSGSDAMQATYIYNGGKWIPENQPVTFPDNKRQPIEINLKKSGTITQDGSAQGLIDADELTWSRSNQVPIRDLANVPMTHVKTMVEFELGTLQATEVSIGSIKAYHVENGNKWQAIIEPQTESFTVSVTVNGSVSTAEVKESDSPTDGVFKANYRYTVPLVLNGTELKLGTIGVGSWIEGAGGTAEGVTPTRYTLTGLENQEIEIYLAGNATPTTVTLDQNGSTSQPTGAPVGIVEKIVYNGNEYLIGREESGEIKLKIVGGAVVLRDADADGFIPVNTLAELRLIDTDDASRGNKYLQESNIDLMNLEWTPISKMNGTYDGGNYSLSNLNVSLGKGNAGLFAENAGTIKNVVIESASALNGEWHAGFICGENKGTIESCVNNASITDGGVNTLGGICGYNNSGIIKNCKNTGTLVIENRVPSDATGGICGYGSKGEIIGCINTGKIDGKPKNTGGIIGSADQVSIADCANIGELILPWGAGDNNGGICGKTSGAMTITRCYNTGTVIVDGSQAGGICGQLSGEGIITACYNAGKVGAKWNSGGIAGQSTDAQIIACYNTGLVEGQTNGWVGAGGICGYHKGTITACYNTGDVIGDSAIGAITGEHNSGNVSYCFWSNDIDGINPNDGGTSTGNAKFGGSNWPSSSLDAAWQTTAENPDAYWKTLGSSGGSYPVLAWE